MTKTTQEPRLVARWTHPRGNAFVELRAHDADPMRLCYTVRAQGAGGVLWCASDADAVAEVERRIAVGCYTPDAYKRGLTRTF